MLQERHRTAQDHGRRGLPRARRTTGWRSCRCPRPGPGEVLVKVEVRRHLRQRPQVLPRRAALLGRRHREGYCQPPITPGHEFVGEVVALGEGAGEKYGLDARRPGGLRADRALLEVPLLPDRQVLDVRRSTTSTASASAPPAPWPSTCIFPAGALNHKVPDERSRRTTPPSSSRSPARSTRSQRGNIEFQDTVVIAGAGPLGLGMVAAARMKGPRLLIAVDLNDARLEMARRCGADIGLNPAKVDVVDEVRKLTDGYGCDVYIEATGHPQAVVDGLAHDPQARHLRRVLA